MMDDDDDDEDEHVGVMMIIVISVSSFSSTYHDRKWCVPYMCGPKGCGSKEVKDNLCHYHHHHQ